MEFGYNKPSVFLREKSFEIVDGRRRRRTTKDGEGRRSLSQLKAPQEPSAQLEGLLYVCEVAPTEI